MENEKIKAYVQVFIQGGDYKEAYYKYREEIESVTPRQIFQVFSSFISEGVQPEKLLIFLDKTINAFYKGLSEYTWKRPQNDNFLKDLEEENRGLEKKLEEIKNILKKSDFDVRKQEVTNSLKELLLFKDHYLKKENILFPYMEKKMDIFSGLSIMWELHNQVWKKLKDGIELFQGDITESIFNKLLAEIFFGFGGVIKKEELILFPAACEVLSEEEWYQMHRQSYEYSTPFLEKKDRVPLDERQEESEMFVEGKFKTETGELSFKEIERIFNNLPVDMTYVDEYNKVRFFSRPKDRIFPRSSAVIGRDVKNCHPPSSVHVVEEIVESFRNGSENTAIFWINIKGKMVLIQYFALRDIDGKYKGVLEVSQDITSIQKLQGEKRLL